jgi:transposase InsO family protein
MEAGVNRWMNVYNHERIHQSLNYEKPWSVYRPATKVAQAT